MGSDQPMVEYQSGETFRSQAHFMMVIAIFMVALNIVLMFVLMAMRIYFGMYLHRAGVEHPVWLLVFEGAVVLEGIWAIIFLVRLILCGFVRISDDGIEYRKTRKIWLVEWKEVTGAEFTRRGRGVFLIKIQRGSGVKPLKLVMGFLFSKESRERIEMLIRERVPGEFQKERRRPWWR